MMSYPIIFQTKVVKINDNEIIHFNRTGCNNDDEGRVANVYEAKIRTIEDFKRMAERFIINSKPYKETGVFDLKVGSKWCSFYDYGMYLLRALKRADNLETFKNNYAFRATVIKGIEATDTDNAVHKVFSIIEYPDIFDIYYESFYKSRSDNRVFEGIDFSKASCRKVIDYIYDIKDSIDLIKEGFPIEFYIKKNKKEK
jgi:hypothetical protein|nr:MAG TPA: hypothetical protein [Caudoviricetes sp.]